MTQTQTEKKIMEIEAHLETETSILPGFGSYVKKKQIEEYMVDLKEAVNEDLTELDEIKKMREEIILEAQKKADHIRLQVKKEVEEEDIVLQARDKAKEILIAAQEKASTTIQEAKDLRNQLIINSHRYVDNMFDGFEKDLLKIQEDLSKNREQLRTSLENKMELMEEVQRN